jgi:hypothetical protein
LRHSWLELSANNKNMTLLASLLPGGLFLGRFIKLETKVKTGPITE